MKVKCVHRAHAPSTPSYFSPTQTTAPFVRVASVLELTCGSNPIVAVSRISRNMKPSMQCQCRARICLYLRFWTLMASKNISRSRFWWSHIPPYLQWIMNLVWRGEPGKYVNNDPRERKSWHSVGKSFAPELHAERKSFQDGPCVWVKVFSSQRTVGTVGCHKLFF